MRSIPAILLMVDLVCCSFVPAAEPFERVTWEMDGLVLLPWKTLQPDPAYRGQWLVAGDLDNDGQAEIVTARNDQQIVTTVLANKLDGSVLWRWGQANAGRYHLGYDVPVQLYDLDGDGQLEVYIGIKGFVLVLNGRDGKEIRRLPLPKGLQVADCIAFANLRGLKRAQDILIKDRYEHIWAYTGDWKPLWDWKPTKYKTAHYPAFFDIDGDGRDDIMAGYTLLDHNGKERWTMTSKAVDLALGHQDCCEVFKSGKKPEDFRLVVSCCSANNVAMLDGLGKTLWEVPGQHFESIDIGRLRDDLPDRQIVVDIDHEPFRKSPVWLIDSQGKRLGSFLCGYGRHHRLIDWNGDGLDEIVIGNPQRMFNGKGECVARLGPLGAFEGEDGPSPPDRDCDPFVMVGDLDGDERPEIILYSMKKILIYRSETAAKVPKLKLGTGVNFTLY